MWNPVNWLRSQSTILAVRRTPEENSWGHLTSCRRLQWPQSWYLLPRPNTAGCHAGAPILTLLSDVFARQPQVFQVGELVNCDQIHTYLGHSSCICEAFQPSCIRLRRFIPNLSRNSLLLPDHGQRFSCNADVVDVIDGVEATWIFNLVTGGRDDRKTLRIEWS